MKVAFHTLGCKVNSYESQAMLNMFEEAGYEEVDFKEVADVYVVIHVLSQIQEIVNLVK